MKILKCSKYNLQDYRRGYKSVIKISAIFNVITDKFDEKKIYKYHEPKLKKDEDWFKINNKIFYTKNAISRLLEK